MNGLDAIKAILPSLKPNELEALKTHLGLKTSPCDTLGHKYRKAGLQQRFLMPPRVRLFCEQCGHSTLC